VGNEVSITYNNKIILKGYKQKNGLFQVKMKANQKEKSYLTEDCDNAAKIWHRKLGHIGHENLKILMKISEGINLTTDLLEKMEKVCKICLEAKQTRTKFDNNRVRAKRPLQIIHTDLCGPISPETWDGYKYFITFLDDFTHFTTLVYLLKSKNEVAEKLKDFAQKIEAKWNFKIAKIRGDNGREYINNTVIQWCKNKGIEIDTTVLHTPQLNGRAERLNRTLMEKVRALLFDAGVKKELWGEALYTATYILNRSPTYSLKKTPYEMWEERKPNLLNLQIFGCEAFAKVLGSLKKLDSRSENYKFVGYAPSGYRLWDSKKRKIIIARDVKFKLNDKTNYKEEVKYKRKINLIMRLKEDNDDLEEENKNLDYEENKNVLEDAENEEILQKELENVEDNQEDEKEDYSKAERIINTRKIGRRRKLPEKFKDYVYLTYTEAITGTEDRNKWIETINEEKKSLKENDVWEIVNENHILTGKPLHSKWIFRIK